MKGGRNGSVSFNAVGGFVVVARVVVVVVLVVVVVVVVVVIVGSVALDFVAVFAGSSVVYIGMGV